MVSRCGLLAAKDGNCALDESGVKTELGSDVEGDVITKLVVDRLGSLVEEQQMVLRAGSVAGLAHQPDATSTAARCRVGALRPTSLSR
jgi:hypothetical protein